MSTRGLICRYSGSLESAEFECRPLPLDSGLYHTGTQLLHYYKTNEDLDMLFNNYSADVIIDPKSLEMFDKVKCMWGEIKPITIGSYRELLETVKEGNIEYCYMFSIDTNEWGLLDLETEKVNVGYAFKEKFLKEWYAEYLEKYATDKGIDKEFELKADLFKKIAEKKTEDTVHNIKLDIEYGFNLREEK